MSPVLAHGSPVILAMVSITVETGHIQSFSVACFLASS